MTLAYLTTARLPTEKAHGLQIVENCAALAEAGANVTLVAARRRATSTVAPPDPRDHYGVGHGFAVEQTWCVDPTGRDVGAAFHVMSTTAALGFARWVRRHRDRSSVAYTRDPLVLLVLSHAVRHVPVVFEAHQMASSARGTWLHRQCMRRAALVVAVTSHLERYARGLGARQTLVSPCGVREARFASMPSRGVARDVLGLPRDAFVVGYVGRLETLGTPKGVHTLVDAIARLPGLPATLAIVGGPASDVEALRSRWAASGLGPERFVAPGSVAPGDVATWLAAFDVATMTFPDTPHYARCASPLKLFEYLAAGLPIVASDLPSLRDVLDDDNALLVAPGDVSATATALEQLHRDEALRRRLSEAAKTTAARFTLGVRARRILSAIASHVSPGCIAAP